MKRTDKKHKNLEQTQNNKINSSKSKPLSQYGKKNWTTHESMWTVSTHLRKRSLVWMSGRIARSAAVDRTDRAHGTFAWAKWIRIAMRAARRLWIQICGWRFRLQYQFFGRLRQHIRIFRDVRNCFHRFLQMPKFVHHLELFLDHRLQQIDECAEARALFDHGRAQRTSFHFFQIGFALCDVMHRRFDQTLYGIGLTFFGFLLQTQRIGGTFLQFGTTSLVFFCVLLVDYGHLSFPVFNFFLVFFICCNYEWENRRHVSIFFFSFMICLFMQSGQRKRTHLQRYNHTVHDGCGECFHSRLNRLVSQANSSQRRTNLFGCTYGETKKKSNNIRISLNI